MNHVILADTSKITVRGNSSPNANKCSLDGSAWSECRVQGVKKGKNEKFNLTVEASGGESQSE